MTATTTAVRWMPIPGWEQLYSVSDDGRVYSERSGIVLKHRLSAGVYPQVGLSNSGLRHFVTVHRLVLLAFAGPCPEGMLCCHGDGDSTNNHLSNLRWDTPANNCRDRDAHGTTSRGVARANSKLCAASVLAIREKYAHGGIRQPELAARYGVARVTISGVVCGRSWKHVGGPIWPYTS